MWLAALWLACGVQVPTPSTTECDPAPLAPGHVRARRIGCSDEILPSGEARQGDWLLENAMLRLAIRDATVSLTQLTGTGGTLIDAALPGRTDGLVEVIPSVRGTWMESAEVSAWTDDDTAGIRVTGHLPDGSEAEVGYTLTADSVELELTGMDGITLVPMTNSTLEGNALESPLDGDWLLFSPDTQAIDLGGWVQWTDPSVLSIGHRSAVHHARWPAGREVRGTSDGDWVVAVQDGAVTARYPVDEGKFEAWIPATLDGLQAIASGADPSGVRPARNGQHLAIGEVGKIKLHVTDEAGLPLPATLTWNGTDHPWLPGDGPLAVGPGTGSGVVSAGLAYDTVVVPSQSLSGTADLEVQLTRQIGDALLARLDVVGAPDPTERQSSDRILRAQAALGVRWAVLVARDEVPRVSLSDSTEEWMHAQAGSVSGGVYGTPMTWPWSTDTDSPAHGATPWHMLSAVDMLDVMTRAGSRRAVIDSAWVEAAGAPSNWGIRPEAFRIEDLDDLPAYLDLLEHWVPVTPVGPWTWVEGIREEEASTTEAVRGILAGRSTATTGPRLVLTVDGVGPGELLPESQLPTKRIRLQVTASADWAPSHAAILTDAGEVGRWELTDPAPALLDVQTSAERPDWVLAIAWTEESDGPWAVSAPVWVGRP